MSEGDLKTGDIYECTSTYHKTISIDKQSHLVPGELFMVLGTSDRYIILLTGEGLKYYYEEYFELDKDSLSRC